MNTELEEKDQKLTAYLFYKGLTNFIEDLHEEYKFFIGLISPLIIYEMLYLIIYALGNMTEDIHIQLITFCICCALSILGWFFMYVFTGVIFIMLCFSLFVITYPFMFIFFKLGDFKYESYKLALDNLKQTIIKTTTRLNCIVLNIKNQISTFLKS